MNNCSSNHLMIWQQNTIIREVLNVIFPVLTILSQSMSLSLFTKLIPDTFRRRFSTFIPQFEFRNPKSSLVSSLKFDFYVKTGLTKSLISEWIIGLEVSE